MSTSADLFPHLAEMTTADLARRRKEIYGDRTSIGTLSDAELDEIAVIVSLLRRKQSGPPREKPKAKTPAPKGLSLDQLLDL